MATEPPAGLPRPPDHSQVNCSININKIQQESPSNLPHNSSNLQKTGSTTVASSKQELKRDHKTISSEISGVIRDKRSIEGDSPLKEPPIVQISDHSIKQIGRSQQVIPQRITSESSPQRLQFQDDSEEIRRESDNGDYSPQSKVHRT